MKISISTIKKLMHIALLAPLACVLFISGCVTPNPQPVFPQPVFAQPSQQLFYAGCVMGSKDILLQRGRVITPELAQFVGSNCICMANNKQLMNLFRQYMQIKMQTINNPNAYSNQAQLDQIKAQMNNVSINAEKQCIGTQGAVR